MTRLTKQQLQTGFILVVLILDVFAFAWVFNRMFDRLIKAIEAPDQVKIEKVYPTDYDIRRTCQDIAAKNINTNWRYEDCVNELKKSGQGVEV
jgi:hypothetical protein